MNTEERAHIAHLLQIHHAHLRELELQAAKYGDLAVPTYIVLQAAQQRETIAVLEKRMQAELPNHNLPPRDYEQFVGRQPELAAVRKLLLPYPKSRAYVITVDGIGGIGKSALALETAYAFRDQYASLPEDERFEAIVWVSAKRSYLTADGILERRQAFRTLDDLYTAIAQVLDYPAITRAKVEEQRVIVEEVLREQRTLLILDNLETVDDDELLSFLHELPDPAKAIVTTRHRIDVARPVRLTGMSHADALALIAQETGRKGVMLSADEQEQLWQRTGGVPLAIVWSIGLMGLGGSVESVLRRLGSGQSDIARFCFEESVAQIHGRDAHKLLLALSLFATDASREVLGIVAGLGEDAFGRDTGLEDLLRLSLVNKESERFSLLPLTRNFVYAEAMSQSVWILSARKRLLENIFSIIEAGSYEKLDWAATDRVEHELQNIVAVFDQALTELRYTPSEDNELLVVPEQELFAQRLLHLNRALVWVCRIRGYWSDCERLCLAGITLSKAIGDVASLGYRYHDLSRIHYFRSDLVNAYRWSMEARITFEREGLTKSICYIDKQLGLIALYGGDIDRGSILISQALNEYKRIGGSGALASYIGAMGELNEVQGDLEAAERYYQQAIEIYRQRNNTHNLAADLLNLGRVKLAQDHLHFASQYLIESLSLARECGRADIIGKSLHNSALVAYNQGNRALAGNQAHQALDLFRRLGMKREQAEAQALLTQAC